MMKLHLLTLFVLCSLKIFGIENALNVKFVSLNSGTSYDGILNELLDSLRTETSLKNIYKNKISVTSTDYDENYKVFKKNHIASLTPTRYITAKKKLNNSLIPLFIVVKDCPYSNGYYQASFISSKGEKNFLDSEKDFAEVDKIFLVHRLSTSGYIYPLLKLYQMGFIKYPCACKNDIDDIWTVQKNSNGQNIEIVLLGSHEAVIDIVKNNDNSIGAVWNPDTTVKVLLNYESIPQDVLFISSDLRDYQDTIKYWFKKSVRENYEVFKKSSLRISGLIDFKSEHILAYEEVYRNYKNLENCENRYCKGFFNGPWFLRNRTGFIIGFISSLTVVVFVGLVKYLIQIRRKRILSRGKNYN